MKKQGIAKTIFFTILFSLGVNCIVNAQTHYEGQFSLSLNGGIAKDGYYGNINIQKLIGSHYFLGRIDASYMSEDVDFKLLNESGKVDYKVYNLGLAVGYSLEEIIPHPFYIQLFIGPFLGYEELNKANDEYNGIKYDDPSGVVFGGYGGIEIEFSLISKLSLIGTFTQFYKANSDIGDGFFQAGAGLKFNF